MQDTTRRSTLLNFDFPFWGKNPAGVELFPGGFPFGSFQGVHRFNDFRGFFSDNVRSQIAVSGRPFCCRVRTSDAVLPCGKGNRALAALAAVYNRIAFPPVEGAPLFPSFINGGGIREERKVIPDAGHHPAFDAFEF